MANRKSSSTFSRNELCITNCNLTYAVNLLGGRWKLQILSLLENQPRRFSELKSEFSYMSERMLTLQLRALEKDGLIKRTVYAEVPPRVEYEQTALAIELKPILDQLSAWGNKHRQQTQMTTVRSLTTQK
jgi:DNA-binding HxlR family transcriptional regulator